MATTKTKTTTRRECEDYNYKTASEFMEISGMGVAVGSQYNVRDSFSKVVRGFVRVVSMERGKISCIINVKPPTLNFYGILFGGVVAAVAERVAIGCAATVVGDAHLRIGEINLSFLAPAPPNAEVVVDASVISSGRNGTVVALDFRINESQRLAYVSRVTLHKIPLSNL